MNPIVNRFVRRCQGRTGSPSFCSMLARLCHQKNITHNTADTQSVPKTTADLHGYSVPPSCTAVTRSTEAAKIRKAPGKSKRRSKAGSNDLVFGIEGSILYGKLAGIATKSMTSTSTPGGALAQLNVRLIYASFRIRNQIPYFMRNTHLQVVWSLIKPPSTGPRTAEKAYAADKVPERAANRLGGTIWRLMTRARV